MIRRLEFKATRNENIISTIKHFRIDAIGLGIEELKRVRSRFTNSFTDLVFVKRNDEPIISIPVDNLFVVNQNSLSLERVYYKLREPIYISSSDLLTIQLSELSAKGLPNDLSTDGDYKNHIILILYGDYVDVLPPDYENNYLLAFPVKNDDIIALTTNSTITLFTNLPFLARIRRVFVNYISKVSLYDSNAYYFVHYRNNKYYIFKLQKLKAVVGDKSKYLILSDDVVNETHFGDYSLASSLSLTKLSSFYIDTNTLAQRIEYTGYVQFIPNILTFTNRLTITETDKVVPVVFQVKKEVQNYGREKERKEKAAKQTGK
jgi:hypothetical protein